MVWERPKDRSEKYGDYISSQGTMSQLASEKPVEGVKCIRGNMYSCIPSTVGSTFPLGKFPR